MRGKRSNRDSRQERIGDWETSDGVNIAGPPAITPPPVWGGNIGVTPGAGLGANAFASFMIAAQKPLQQPAGVISVGAATIMEVDAQFDMAGLNPAGVPPNLGFVVMGCGLYKGIFDRGSNSFGVMDPLNGNDMTQDRWLVHRQQTFMLPTAAVIASSTAALSQRVSRIGFRFRRRITVQQGENITIALSNIMPAGFVSISGVSWVRWRYLKVW